MPLDTQGPSAAAFDLPEATRELRETALAFAKERLAPNALRMGRGQAFPGRRDPRGGGARHGRHLRPRGGRLRPVPPRRRADHRGAGDGCPAISAYISIHNMVAWMIDRYGSDAQRGALDAEARPDGAGSASYA